MSQEMGARTKKPRKVWDNIETIGEIRKAQSTKAVVSLASRQGVKMVHVKEWYRKKGETEWKPSGNDAMNFPIELPVDGEIVLPATELVELLKQAIAKAPDFELENEANAVYYSPKIGD